MATTPPSQISVKIRKSMPYRGNTVIWSNRWFFDKTTLPSTADRDAIAQTIWNQELVQYTTKVTIVDAIWYAAGSDVPVSTSHPTGACTLATAGHVETPGDCASLLRFSTTQRTSKNHPIYLFKYFHDVRYDTGGNADTVSPVQSGRNLTLGNLLVAGITQGAVTYKVAGPQGAVGQGVVAEPLITHRDFPR
jgi:hypothetical protein